MRELRPILLANTLCLAAMMSFIPVVGPIIRALGLAEWHGGLVTALAGLLWILLAKPWGRASDTRGRKPILLLGIGGFAIAYLLLAAFLDLALSLQFGLFSTLLALALIRSAVGAFYAAIPPVSAALVADRSDSRTRAAAMAALGAANGLGMVLGPLIGGALAGHSLALPMYVSAALPVLALLIVWRTLPHTPAQASTAAAPGPLFDPRLRLAQSGSFLAMSGVVTAQMCVGFFALDKLGLDAAGGARVAGYAMAAVGVTLIAAQILVSRLPRVALRVWLQAGALLAAAGLGTVVLAHTPVMLVLSYCLCAAGMGMIFPALQALAANAVTSAEQGMAAGSVSAAQGLATVAVPLFCTLLYQIAPELPYLVASAMLLGIAALARLHGRGAPAADTATPGATDGKKRPRRYLYRIAAGALILIAVAAILMRETRDSAANATSDASPAPRPALTVKVAPPRSEDLPIRLAANGTIAAWQEAVIGSDMAGLRLIEVKVNVGDAVQAGQILAVFDDETVRVDVAQAQATLAEAQAMVLEAQANAQRARSLTASGVLSRQLIDQYLAAEQTAQARVAAASASLAAQQLRLKRTKVRAPDDGVISSRNATVGAVVGLGGELFRMVRQGRLEWRAELTSSELERVTEGAQAELTLVGGRRITGTVRMVAPTVDAQTRAGLAYVDLPSDRGIRSGMFARGEFELGNSSAITVPLNAVVMREAFTYVFRLTEDGRARQTKVAIGRRTGDRIEIIDGLSEDAQIIIAGAGFLNDGDLVRVAGETAAAATTADATGY